MSPVWSNGRMTASTRCGQELPYSKNTQFSHSRASAISIPSDSTVSTSMGFRSDA
jgi:hypothetical protein